MTNKEKFKDTLDSLYKELCDVSDWMYHNPELGFEEYETSKYLVNFIESKNAKVNDPSHSLDTAFDVTFGDSGPLEPSTNLVHGGANGRNRTGDSTPSKPKKLLQQL